MIFFKFKKPAKDSPMPMYLVDGLLCNGHWLIDIAWLETCKSVESGVAKAILQSKRVLDVTDLLEGAEAAPAKALQSLIKKIKLSEYSAIDLNGATAKIESRSLAGETRPRITTVSLKFKREVVKIDAEYFPLLFFDRDVAIHAKDKNSVLVILKADRIVGLLMPIRQ